MNHEENTLQESNSLAACICERREEEEKERGRGGLFMQQSWHRREAMRARGRARHRAGDRRPTAVLFVCTGPASEWQSFLTVLSAAGISARSSECLDAEHTCWLNVMEKTSGAGRRCSGQHSRLIEGSGFDSRSGSCLWLQKQTLSAAWRFWNRNKSSSSFVEGNSLSRVRRWIFSCLNKAVPGTTWRSSIN